MAAAAARAQGTVRASGERLEPAAVGLARVRQAGVRRPRPRSRLRWFGHGMAAPSAAVQTEPDRAPAHRPAGGLGPAPPWGPLAEKGEAPRARPPRPPSPHAPAP